MPRHCLTLDLQNDPADLPRLLDKLGEGYDAVMGLRARRHDHFVVRKLPSWAGNWLIPRVFSGRDESRRTLRLRRSVGSVLELPIFIRRRGAR